MVEAQLEVLYPWKAGNVHFQGDPGSGKAARGWEKGKAGLEYPQKGKFP